MAIGNAIIFGMDYLLEGKPSFTLPSIGIGYIKDTADSEKNLT
jgi:hypothetical protein